MSQFNPAPNNSIGEKLVARYTHTGNQEIYISSVDWATGTFTTPTPHGLVSVTTVLLTPNYYDMLNPTRDILSIPMEWIKPQGVAASSPNTGIALLPIDAVTLKVVKGSDGTTALTVNPTSLENNNNLDFTKFHFEITISWVIDNLPLLKKFRIRSYGYAKTFLGNNQQQYRYTRMYWTGEDGTVNNEYGYIAVLGFTMNANPYAVGAVHSIQDWIVDATTSYIIITVDGYHGGRRAGFSNLVFDRWRETSANASPAISQQNKALKGITKLATYGPTNAYMANGSIVDIYDLGGR